MGNFSFISYEFPLGKKRGQFPGGCEGAVYPFDGGDGVVVVVLYGNVLFDYRTCGLHLRKIPDEAERFRFRLQDFAAAGSNDEIGLKTLVTGADKMIESVIYGEDYDEGHAPDTDSYCADQGNDIDYVAGFFGQQVSLGYEQWQMQGSKVFCSEYILSDVSVGRFRKDTGRPIFSIARLYVRRSRETRPNKRPVPERFSAAWLPTFPIPP